MRTGQYDGVSASGNATLRLVDGGDVAPVNIEPRPELQDDLRRPQEPALQHVRRRPLRDPARPRRQPADVELGRRQAGADSWNVVFDPKVAAKYKGKITAYDDPIYIADAAVYLKTHQPDLGINNPYELNEEAVRRGGRPAQGTARQRRRVLVRRTKQIQAFAQRRHRWSARPGRYQYFALKGEGKPVAASPPARASAQGGRDRLVGHLDDQLQGQASELHVHVDELDRLAEGQRRGRASASARRRPRA